MLVMVQHSRRRRGGLHKFGIVLCLGALAALVVADVARAQTRPGGSGGRIRNKTLCLNSGLTASPSSRRKSQTKTKPSCSSTNSVLANATCPSFC